VPIHAAAVAVLKPIALSAALLFGLMSVAGAQTCDYPPSGNPVAYVAPAPGTKIRYEDVTLRKNNEQTRRELDYTALNTSATETEWTIHLASGQGIAVRTFLGLMQTVNSSGTSSSFDIEKYARLWPLDGGKTVNFVVTTAAQAGTQYRAALSLCVRRFETLSLSAGDFKAVVIDSHSQIVEGGANIPFDEVYTRYWYVPEYGIYLQRVRAMYMQRREVMKQTRRALSVGGK
jgi:hypothetical protein